MIQSQDYTVGSAIAQALESLRVADIERYGITELLLVDWLHSCILDWFAQAIPQVGGAYYQTTELSTLSNPSTLSGQGSVSGTVLTVTGITLDGRYPGSNFVISIGGTLYSGQIETVISSTTANVLLQATTPSSTGSVLVFVQSLQNQIDISSLRMAEPGDPTTFYLESSILPSKNIAYMSYESFLGFRPASALSKRFVAYTIIDDTLYLKTGDALSSTGNLKLVYLRIPDKMTLMTDKPAVLDHHMPNVIDRLTVKIASVLGVQVPQSLTERTAIAKQASDSTKRRLQVEGSH